MNRYTITNLRNGQEHQVIGDVMPDRSVQPGWGTPAVTKPKADCDPWELSNGSDGGVDIEGRPLWNVIDSMGVVVTNIDAEILAENQKKQQHENRLVKLASLSKADLKTAGNFDLDKVADALLDVAKVVRRIVKGD